MDRPALNCLAPSGYLVEAMHTRREALTCDLAAEYHRLPAADQKALDVAAQDTFSLMRKLQDSPPAWAKFRDIAQELFCYSQLAEKAVGDKIVGCPAPNFEGEIDYAKIAAEYGM